MVSFYLENTTTQIKLGFARIRINRIQQKQSHYGKQTPFTFSPGKPYNKAKLCKYPLLTSKTQPRIIQQNVNKVADKEGLKRG
jgi:hypothetical protein